MTEENFTCGEEENNQNDALIQSNFPFLNFSMVERKKIFHCPLAKNTYTDKCKKLKSRAK